MSKYFELSITDICTTKTFYAWGGRSHPLTALGISALVAFISLNHPDAKSGLN